MHPELRLKQLSESDDQIGGNLGEMAATEGLRGDDAVA